MEPVGNSPQEFALVIKSDVTNWAKVIRESGAKPE
jgi:tripartite-type tricarboxylate transporter receptor subunit TctC